MKTTAISTFATVALSVLLAAPTAKADHHENLAWWEFLAGSWTIEYSNDLKGEATYKMAPTGKALIGEWRTVDAPSVISFDGMQGTQLISTGYTSDGGFWRITIRNPREYKQEGVIIGANSEGNYSGEFVAEKINENQLRWELDAKYSGGEELKLSATMTRKK